MKTPCSIPKVLCVLLAGTSMMLSSGQVRAQATLNEAAELEDECQSEFGTCYLTAYEADASGTFAAFAAECECANGFHWGSDMSSHKGQSLDSAFTQRVCSESLANCKPPRIPGPSEIEIFPKDELATVVLACEQETPHHDNDVSCTVINGEERVQMYCECAGDDTHGFDAPAPYPMSQHDLHKICLDGMNTCKAMPGDESPKVDVEDALEALGCTLAANSSPAPLSLAMGIFFLGGFIRRKRQQ